MAEKKQTDFNFERIFLDNIDIFCGRFNDAASIPLVHVEKIKLLKEINIG